MSKKLPQTIYGHWHEEGTTDEFFRTDIHPNDLVESGETLKVGVYELVGYTEIVNKTETKPVTRVKGK